MTNTGKVYLVGAGPGDPQLLTLKGLRCLQQADLVLYDGLVNPLVLRHVSADCERTGRAAGPDGKRIDQEEINRRLVEAGLAGKTVVRLKGGDPYVFGRGSEEARALVEAGIEFEIVPGITAAVAAAEYAGISLTHRKLASSVAFITGHEDPEKAESSLDYANLASFSGTLVFYMGLHRLPRIVNALIEYGKDPATPACVISRATTTRQRTVSARLSELPGSVADAALAAPSLIVVGSVVSQRDELAWFERQPLFGQRVGITRARHQAEETAVKLIGLGAEPVFLPMIRILPPADFSLVDAAIAGMSDFDWIVFSSSNAVRGLLHRVLALGHDMRLLSNTRIAAVGPATQQALNDYSLRADVLPMQYDAASLAKHLRDDVVARRVLWPRGSRFQELLRQELSVVASEFREVEVYRSEDSEPADQFDDLDWVMVTSAAIARNLVRVLPRDVTVRFASISAATTEILLDAGLHVDAQAREATVDGVLDAIIAALPS